MTKRVVCRAFLSASAATMLAASGGAQATVNPAVTAQAQAADAAFLAYAPPPSGPPGALCLVDTGVASNPDTAPGLLASYSVNASGTETPQDSDPQGHGTIEAMIAGAAGAQGMIGAWPQLKVVSLQATQASQPGQEPEYQFKDYYEALNECVQYAPTYHIKVALLALNSTIPPSPDQAQQFAASVEQLNALGVAVVASAGNYMTDSAGPAEEPAAEPGVFVVGASTAQPGSVSATQQGAPCTFSAQEDVSFYAPGCGLNQASPFTDEALPGSLGDGTSQAAAFAAAVMVALMSYDPELTYADAENILVQTAAAHGNLDAAAAFQSAGLDAIVTAGNAAVPNPPSASPTVTAPAVPSTTPGAPSVPTPSQHGRPVHRSSRARLTILRWKGGRLLLGLSGVPSGAFIRVTLHLRHRVRQMTVAAQPLIALATPRPRSITLRVLLRGHQVGRVLARRL